MRDAPYAGLCLVSYEQLKQEGAAFVQPLSYSSTRTSQRVRRCCCHTLLMSSKYATKIDTIHCESTIRTIWMGRGIMGFFYGISLRLSRKVLSSAIGWATYEAILVFIHNQPRLFPSVT
ncbi:hypothetical protein JB92DRAFT_2041157 [Gautieria morchelliformis]|nr:hypothetical protein JB92DRAFT_2041157 [Gautieria morchelliformis]